MAESEVSYARPAGARRGIWFAVLLTVFEIGASIWIFGFALNHGASNVGAYLWACLAPLIGAAVYFLRTRDVSGASIAILAFNALSAVVATIGNTSPKVLLYKDSFATGLIGLIFLVSLLARKPLVYYFGQRFAGGGTREGDRWWAALWDASPGFRRSQRLITVIWAVALLAEAAVKTIAIRVNNYSTGYIWDQILPIVAFAVAFLLTMVVSRRGQAKGRQQRLAAQP